MNDVYRLLGHRLRVLRDNAGLSQGVIAQRVGLSRTSITNIEMGRQRIYLHTFLQLAAALNVDVRALTSERAVPANSSTSPDFGQWEKRVYRIAETGDEYAKK